MKHSAKEAARQARADDHRGGPRSLLAQLPYWVVLAGVAAGLLTIRAGGQAARSGTLVVASALLAGSLIRLVLPEGRVGLLRSRRRLADVAVMAVLGTGLLIAGLIVQLPS